MIKDTSVSRQTHNKMMKAAKLCARSGEHESAVRLLLNAQVKYQEEKAAAKGEPSSQLLCPPAGEERDGDLMG